MKEAHLWCSAVELSTCWHVHPAGWCSAWTAGIEPATTGLSRPAFSQLSYVHRPDANENRPPGVSPASGFRSVFTPLSRSHSSGQGSIGQQAREHAGMPLVSPAPVACPRFHCENPFFPVIQGTCPSSDRQRHFPPDSSRAPGEPSTGGEAATVPLRKIEGVARGAGLTPCRALIPADAGPVSSGRLTQLVNLDLLTGMTTASSGPPLAGQVALVAGATRGAGRAIAVELARAGAFVYATGRSSRVSGRSEIDRPETVEETGELIAAAGGQGLAVRVDHLEADQVADLVALIEREQDRKSVV